MTWKLSGHAITRYYTANAIDPTTAMIRMPEELDGAREVTDPEEIRSLIRAVLCPHKGTRFLAGETGVFLCRGPEVVTYFKAGTEPNLYRYRQKERRGRRRR